MTNFLSQTFELLWNNLSDLITQTYNVGRGRRSKVSGKDALFVTLTMLKHGGQWDMLARVFDMKVPTFERLVTRFVQLISHFVFACFVEKVGELHTMADLQKSQQTFKAFPEARYATDVTFQHAFRPSGSIEKGKRYFSGKHKLYGYKVEISVMSDGLALGMTAHYPGSVSDFEILQRNRDWHLNELAKRGLKDSWRIWGS